MCLLHDDDIHQSPARTPARTCSPAACSTASACPSLCSRYPALQLAMHCVYVVQRPLASTASLPSATRPWAHLQRDLPLPLAPRGAGAGAGARAGADARLPGGRG
jgi:hypothetical protein